MSINISVFSYLRPHKASKVNKHKQDLWCGVCRRTDLERFKGALDTYTVGSVGYR